jgi:hypothetical protein
MKPTYTLYDHSFLPFGSKSASLDGDRHGEAPTYFEWSHNIRYPGNIFYSDQALSQVQQNPHVLEIGWIIEPPWKSGPYDTASALHDRFDYVLTYHRTGTWHSNYLYYPIGGSWIAERDWNPTPTKTKLVSIIGTQKVGAPGHRLRHSAIRLFSDRLDVYGRGYNPIPSKLPALAPYYFSLIIESQRIPGYFTEKLIDCMCMGTIPIYWGDPHIDLHFLTDGIIQIEDLEELYYILPDLSSDLYAKMSRAALENFELAKRYACVEDWLYLNYPYLFH